MPDAYQSLTELAPGLAVRGIAPPLRLADFRLIAFDMDATLGNIECIDEVADVAGRGAEVAAITAAAMRGEITDFKTSLRRRVAMLRGTTLAQLEEVRRERHRANPGAVELLAACRAAGLKTLLVSGGFTFFAEPFAEKLGMDYVRANVLEMEGGVLTGRLLDQPWGDIVDGAQKRATLLEVCAQIGCAPQQAIAVGDGANDLPMMEAAGLSVGWHAKPRVRDYANVVIDEGGLDRLLEVVQP
ncbi:MAG: phosphoserine phosphatase SerB [Ottowia sp.]|nr:phosphoserine phosphatase SerB [Ottowia sp.]